MPSHRNELHLPDGTVQLIDECFPLYKMEGHVQNCKYCDFSGRERHGNWWMMNQEDYRVEGLVIILCGDCEHTVAMEESAA